jgi:hypothetical protein
MVAQIVRHTRARAVRGPAATTGATIPADSPPPSDRGRNPEAAAAFPRAHANRPDDTASFSEADRNAVMVASTLGASVAGPFVAACALLVASGADKLARPAGARVAVRAAGLPFAGAVVAAFGTGEIAAGTAGAIFGGHWALGVAACYVALTAFAFTLLRRAPSTPCACLGSSHAAVTPFHVVLDALAAGVAIVATWNGSPWAQFSGHWIVATVFVVLVACCARLASLALETLPVLEAAAKEGSS